MTDHRDPELGHRLAELATPEHSPDFWTSLRAELDNSTRSGPDADVDLVENEADDDLVDLTERRARRSPKPLAPWLVAAAVVLVALLAGGVLLANRADDRTDVATDPAPDGPPTSVPSDGGSAVLPRPVGEPMDRGAGRVIAADPTSSFLYVADVAPEDGTGCEGAPRDALYVEPVDGGPRQLALPVDALDATGRLDMRFGADGEVVLVPTCEGFGSRLLTGRIAGDGRIVEVNELGVNDLELGEPVHAIEDVEFIGEGFLAVATRGTAEDGSERRHVYAMPTSPSEASDLELDGTVALAVAPDGRLVTADVDGVIRIDGRLVGSAEAVIDLVVTDDGSHVVVLEPHSLVAWPIDGGEAFGVELDSPSSMRPIGGASVAVDEHGPDGAARIVAVDPLTGDRSTLLDLRVPGWGFVVTAGNQRLLANASVEAHAIVVEQRLTG